MEKFPIFSHYCDDEQNKLFVAYSLKDKATRKYDVPYETVFLFDSAQVGNQIFFTGGGLPASDTEGEKFFRTTARVIIHSNLEASAEYLDNMVVPRANHTLVTLNDNSIYAVGGCNGSGDTSSCEAYDIGKNVWRKCASLTENKKWVSVCTFSAKYLYAFGGACNDSDKDSDVIEYLDTQDQSAKSWARVKLDKGKEYWRHCIFVGVMQITPNAILLFGGHVEKAESQESFIFYPASRTLEKCSQLVKKDEFYRTKPQILGKELMMVGSCLGDLHIYNIELKKWTAMEKNAWNPEDVFHLKAETY